MRGTLFGLVVCALAGCGGEAPRPEPWKARHPASRFITADGFSDEGPDAAEAEARAGVARQIDSSIEATLTVRTGETDGRPSHDIESVTREKARFDRGELIKVVREATHCEGRRCQAFAALDRDEVEDLLGREYVAGHAAFTTAAGAAEGAAGLADFTVRFRQAETAFDALEPRGRQIEGVTGRAYGPYATDRERRDALRARRARMLADLRVTLRLDAAADEAWREPLAGALVGAFRDAGLLAAPGDTCAAGVEFRPAAKVACGLGPLGPSCELQIDGELRDCAAHAGLGTLRARVVGAHPRSEDDARRQLLDRLAGGALAAALRQQIGDVLPTR